MSINLRELRAIRLGLFHFRHSLVDRTVGAFSDNTTALSYIHKQEGTLSPALNQEAQLLLRWAELLGITIVPQFIMGTRNVVANSLSHQDQDIGSEWTLVQEVVDQLGKWPVMVDLFTTSLNYRLPFYFYPLNDPMAAGIDAFLQSWDSFQAYAFPLFALISNILNKLQSSRGVLLTFVAPLWPQKEWYTEFQYLSAAPPVALPSPAPPRASTSHVETVQRFARHLGISQAVARQLSLCHCSSCRLYQHHWECYRRWCADHGHAVLTPSVLKIADFLLFLRSTINVFPSLWLRAFMRCSPPFSSFVFQSSRIVLSFVIWCTRSSLSALIVLLRGIWLRSSIFFAGLRLSLCLLVPLGS